MSHDQAPPNVDEQQEIVRRYAVQLQQAACGTRRPAGPSLRRCYELLNECAMELADVSRRPDTGPATN